MLVLGIDMQNGLMERWFASHGIEHALQEIEKGLTLFRNDFELDHISHRHERTLAIFRRLERVPLIPAQEAVKK